MHATRGKYSPGVGLRGREGRRAQVGIVPKQQIEAGCWPHVLNTEAADVVLGIHYGEVYRSRAALKIER